MGRFIVGRDYTEGIHAVSEGNPGALNVLIQLLNRSNHGTHEIITLDDAGIYGSDIWILYKDCCGENIQKLMDVLQDIRKGILNKNKVKIFIERGEKIPDQSLELVPTCDLVKELRSREAVSCYYSSSPENEYEVKVDGEIVDRDTGAVILVVKD